jgi:hypothetical protein
MEKRMASKANRWATQTAKFQEKQRQAQSKKDYDQLKADIGEKIKEIAASHPVKTAHVTASSPGSTKITGTFKANSTWSTNIPTYWGTGTVTTGTALPSTSSGTIYWGGTVQEATEIVKDDRVPSDDPTRAMVERKILAAIDGCLAANHYPKGIALSQTAMDALKGSPMVGSPHLYWYGESSPQQRFLDLPLHIIETLDPLDVEVGW